jgi:hypothetical protein
LDRLSWHLVSGCSAAAFALAIVVSTTVCGQPPGSQQGNQHHGGHRNDNHGGRGNWSGYQRNAFDSRFKHHDKRRRNDFKGWTSPQINSGWFQRPYPYHLDYYRMKYHGSYEPYFGNLYGPPQVVTAPPYYGPYYGNWGQGTWGGAPGGDGSDVYQRGPVQVPFAPQFMQEVPVENSNPAAKPGVTTKDENLPTP